MNNSHRPKSSLVGMGDFALSAMNYRKMRSIERQNDFTSSALEEIRDTQRFSMAGIISLHNEIEEISRTQWSIIDHLKNMENKGEILGNLKLILVHVEEQSELVNEQSRRYPEFAAMLSMNLKNMLIESEICLSNLKMMSVGDIKWAKKVLEGVDEQYTLLHSNSNEIDIDKVLLLENTLAEISGINQNLIEAQSALGKFEDSREILQNEIDEHEGGFITSSPMIIRDLRTRLNEQTDAFEKELEEMYQKIDDLGDQLSQKWREIQHLVPNNSIEIEVPSERELGKIEIEPLIFVTRLEDLPNGRWLPKDVNWYFDDQGRHWYSTEGGYRVWDK